MVCPDAITSKDTHLQSDPLLLGDVPHIVDIHTQAGPFRAGSFVRGGGHGRVQ